MANGSVAPKERINISYKSSTGGVSEDVELPLKMLIVDDFTGKENDDVIEDRDPINVNKDNFNDVIKSQNLTMNFCVPNRLTENSDEDINIEGPGFDINENLMASDEWNDRLLEQLYNNVEY